MADNIHYHKYTKALYSEDAATIVQEIAEDTSTLSRRVRDLIKQYPFIGEQLKTLTLMLGDTVTFDLKDRSVILIVTKRKTGGIPSISRFKECIVKVLEQCNTDIHMESYKEKDVNEKVIKILRDLCGKYNAIAHIHEGKRLPMITYLSGESIWNNKKKKIAVLNFVSSFETMSLTFNSQLLERYPEYGDISSSIYPLTEGTHFITEMKDGTKVISLVVKKYEDSRARLVNLKKSLNSLSTSPYGHISVSKGAISDEVLEDNVIIKALEDFSSDHGRKIYIYEKE